MERDTTKVLCGGIALRAKHYFVISCSSVKSPRQVNSSCRGPRETCYFRSKGQREGNRLFKIKDMGRGQSGESGGISL